MVFIYPPVSIDTTGLATEAKQDVMISELQDVNTELDLHTTELQAVNTELDAQTVLLGAIDTELDSQTALLTTIDTELDSQTALLTTIDAELDAQTVLLTSLDGKDFATQTTLAALETKAATEAKQDTQITSLGNIEADIDALNARLAGALVPETFDYLELTYVAAGNGAGEVETVIYKTGGAAGTTVATLTLAYDANNNVSSVTRT